MRRSVRHRTTLMGQNCSRKLDVNISQWCMEMLPTWMCQVCKALSFVDTLKSFLGAPLIYRPSNEISLLLFIANPVQRNRKNNCIYRIIYWCKHLWININDLNHRFLNKLLSGLTMSLIYSNTSLSADLHKNNTKIADFGQLIQER